MLGRLVLCWYSKRKPSEEMRRTTGLWSFLRGRATGLWKGWDFETWLRERRGFVAGGEEKKRKAKAEAAERAMQVMMRRDVKMKQLEIVLVLVEESELLLLLLLWRSAIDWLGGSSSGVGIALGFVSPEIIDSLFYLTDLVDVSYGKLRKVQTLIRECLNNLKSDSEREEQT